MKEQYEPCEDEYEAKSEREEPLRTDDGHNIVLLNLKKEKTKEQYESWYCVELLPYCKDKCFSLEPEQRVERYLRDNGFGVTRLNDRMWTNYVGIYVRLPFGQRFCNGDNWKDNPVIFVARIDRSSTGKATDLELLSPNMVKEIFKPDFYDHYYPSSEDPSSEKNSITDRIFHQYSLQMLEEGKTDIENSITYRALEKLGLLGFSATRGEKEYSNLPLSSSNWLYKRAVELSKLKLNRDKDGKLKLIKAPAIELRMGQKRRRIE